MKKTNPFSFSLALASLLLTFSANALESEQISTPKNVYEKIVPLDSVLEKRILSELQQSIQDIYKSQFKMSHALLASKLVKRVADGAPISTVEGWFLKEDAFKCLNCQFRPKTKDSIYNGVSSFPIPGAFDWNAPNVKLGGILMGTDKIGHFFQQGYQYFEIVDTLLKQNPGMPFEQAKAIAIKTIGIDGENGIAGIGVDGVWSNGDLAANYAGMYFYINLANTVTYRGVTLAPILVKSGNTLKLNTERLKSGLITPFISAHFNEAYNPNYFTQDLNKLETNISKFCRTFKRANPQLEDSFFRENFRIEMRTLNNEDYGWQLPENSEVSVYKSCY